MPERPAMNAFGDVELLGRFADRGRADGRCQGYAGSDQPTAPIVAKNPVLIAYLSQRMIARRPFRTKVKAAANQTVPRCARDNAF